MFHTCTCPAVHHIFGVKIAKKMTAKRSLLFFFEWYSAIFFEVWFAVVDICYLQSTQFTQTRGACSSARSAVHGDVIFFRRSIAGWRVLIPWISFRWCLVSGFRCLYSPCFGFLPLTGAPRFLPDRSSWPDGFGRSSSRPFTLFAAHRLPLLASPECLPSAATPFSLHIVFPCSLRLTAFRPPLHWHRFAPPFCLWVRLCQWLRWWISWRNSWFAPLLCFFLRWVCRSWRIRLGERGLLPGSSIPACALFCAVSNLLGFR